MAVGPNTSADIQAFHLFLTEQLVSGDYSCTPEESVEEFRAWQRDAERLHAKLAPSLAQAERGEAAEVDIDSLMSRVAERLASSENTT